jgi:cation:H+ antiporter
MQFSVVVFFVLGLVVLVVGAELLVRGASRLAAAVGISPLIIGLTVVAFGTSAPEMAVSVRSALSGEGGADIAIGNVVGSNIFNILFILGLSAAIAPLVVSQRLVRFDVPLMIGVSVLLLLLALDGRLDRLDGAVLFGGIVAYTIFAIVQGRRESKAVADEYAGEFSEAPGKPAGLALNLGYIVAGLALLILGAHWLVESAIAMARAFGVNELVIGLTIVAAGTSLPEVATSVMASIKGERDIAVGNVVGSNLFNILCVLGLSSLVAPDGINVAPSALHFDIPIMIAVAFACLPIFFTGYAIARWEGLLFLGYYVLYTVFLVAAAVKYPALQSVTTGILAFIVPLTVVTLAVTLWRQWRSGNRHVH